MQKEFNMSIDINKDNVFQQVGMNVSILARSIKDADGNSLYDKVYIQDRDYAVLDQYFASVVGEIVHTLRDFVIGVDGSIVSVEFDERNTEPFIKQVEALCISYAVARVTCEWLKRKAVEYAELYENNAIQLLALIKSHAYHKNIPEMKLYGEDE